MVFMGSKDMLCRVAILNIGWEDTLAPFTIKESATGFKKSLAFQPHGIKQSRGMSGEGITSGPPNGNLAAHALHPM